MINKASLAFILLFLYQQVVFSQSKDEIDSLKKALEENISDKQKVDTYNLISRAYGSQDSINVISNSQKALTLAKKINYVEGMVDAYYEIGWITLKKGYHIQAEEVYINSLNIAQENNYTNGIAKALRGLGLVQSHRGDYNKSLEFHQKSLRKFEEIQDLEGMAYGHINIGVIYKNKGEYNQALQYYQKALALFEKIPDKQGLAYTYNNLGLIYKNQGKYAQALEAYQKALKLFEQVKDKQGLVYVYNNIGVIYKNQENYDLALEYYQKSLKIKQEIGDKKGAAKTYSNIAAIYKRQGKQIEASDYYQKSLELRLQIGDKNGIAHIYTSLGKLALEEKEYDKAKVYFQDALTLREEMKEVSSLPDAYINIGIVFFYQSDLQQSLEYLEKGMKVAFEVGNPEILRNGAEYLAKAYEAQGNYKKAYENHIIFKQMSDSLLNEENIRRTTRLADEFTFSKVEDSLKIVQAQERALHDAEIGQRQTIQIATFVGLGLVASLLVMLFVFYRNKQKSNRELNEANEEIQKINASLEKTIETVEKQRDSILDSINYAQHIQQAALPLASEIEATLSEYFIFFKPLNVVSGDFYWIEKVEGKQFIVVADCTGHGVPGAFMTMLGIQALTDIIIQKGIHSPNKILDNLDLTLQKLLKSANTQIKDGMDIAVCVIDEKENKLSYAGAKNSIIIIQDKKLKEIKGNPRGINWAFHVDNREGFTTHHFPLEKDTTFYLFSDGYQDQFGGKASKKFMKKRFRELLYQIYTKEVSEQKQILEQTLADWMQEEDQVDDILVMGVRA